MRYKPVNQEILKTVAAKIPDKIHDRFLILASKKRMTRSQLLRYAVEKLVETEMPLSRKRKAESQSRVEMQSPEAMRLITLLQG